MAEEKEVAEDKYFYQTLLIKYMEVVDRYKCDGWPEEDYIQYGGRKNIFTNQEVGLLRFIDNMDFVPIESRIKNLLKKE